MADIPRKDMKTVPQQQPEPAVAPPAIPRATGTSLDTFNFQQPQDANGAAASVDDVMEAGVRRLEPAINEPVTQESPAEPAIVPGGVVVTPATAAVAAAQVKDAGLSKLGSEVSDGRSMDPSATIEPSAGIAQHTAFDEALAARLTGAGVADPRGRSSTEDSDLVPFLNPGRAELVGQANEVFVREEADGGSTSSPGGIVSNAGAGGTFGQVGTPGDLGVGAFGPTAGLEGTNAIGMDVFDTTIPTGGTSGAANDLALMRGILPQGGADPHAAPSVAADDALSTAITEAKSQEAQAEAAKNAGVTPPTPAPGTATSSAPKDDGVPEPGFWTTLVADGPTLAVVELVESLSLPTNISQSQQLQQVEDGLGTGLGQARVGDIGQQAGVSNLETEMANMMGGLSKTGKPPGASQPVDPDAAGHPELTPGYLAWRAASRERLNYDPLLPGEGATDPGREGTEQVPEGPPVSNVEAGMAGRAVREFLVGQPGEGIVRGGGSLDFGRLPGDMGNIDYGPDSTGAWSGDTQTEDESDALGSLGGSGLSIADLNNDEEEEDDDSDDSE